MKHVDELRDGPLAAGLAAAIARTVTRPWRLMEVCGGQTHAIMRFGLDELLPPSISLLHGPGCPVCVTPLARIDQAIAIAATPGVTLCSFGDMLRVPGSRRDLLSVKSDGGDVRIVYSPMDALELARGMPGREVVFFAVGFETTAPAAAMAVFEARRQGIANFSLLVSHVLVPPAMEAILGSASRVDAFLAAGHVCTIMGTSEYAPLAARYHVPIVVTGFEPIDIMQGILMCVTQLEEGRAEVENQYTRSVRAEGNAPAMAMMREVFEVVPQAWRGIGEIPESGLALRAAFAAHDAEKKLGLVPLHVPEPEACRSGRVLQGLDKPTDCPEFGGRCTPETPLGATMVSSEGACAAYYRYRRGPA